MNTDPTVLRRDLLLRLRALERAPMPLTDAGFSCLFAEQDALLADLDAGEDSSAPSSPDLTAPPEVS